MCVMPVLVPEYIFRNRIDKSTTQCFGGNSGFPGSCVELLPNKVTMATTAQAQNCFRAGKFDCDLTFIVTVSASFVRLSRDKFVS